MHTESETIDTISKVVAEHAFFAGMKAGDLDLLAQCGELARFEKGDLIFKQGDGAKHFFLIVRGSVLLTHAGLKRNVPILTLSAGDALGWSWLFPPHAWRFNATAMESSKLVRFDGEQLCARCRERPEFGLELMSRMTRVVIDRLQKTRQKYLALSGDL